MKVSEQIAIMKAYENGKTIEQKPNFASEWKILDYEDNHPFDFSCYEYRIATEPKYRPYESVEEAFNESRKHGFWMKHKPSGHICFSARFLEKRNTIYINSQSSVICLDDYVWFDDGSPCGVKI